MSLIIDDNERHEVFVNLLDAGPCTYLELLERVNECGWDVTCAQVADALRELEAMGHVRARGAVWEVV